MQIINNTGAIIKKQINLGDIDNLNIDDLFKNNEIKNRTGIIINRKFIKDEK